MKASDSALALAESFCDLRTCVVDCLPQEARAEYLRIMVEPPRRVEDVLGALMLTYANLRSRGR